MPVYIYKERKHFGQRIMCHMTADTLEELHEMADKLSLKRAWFQLSRGWMPHYDISLSKRKLAVAAGAKEVDSNELVKIMREWRTRR